MDTLADRTDLTGALLAGDEGHAGRRKGAASQVRIDEVDTDRSVPHQDLASARLGDIHILVGEDIRPAITVDMDRFH